LYNKRKGILKNLFGKKLKNFKIFSKIMDRIKNLTKKNKKQREFSTNAISDTLRP
jgi:hypothetical protein